MVQLDRQNLKDPIIFPPKTEEMHLTPNSFLASKQKGHQRVKQTFIHFRLKIHSSESITPKYKTKKRSKQQVQCVASSLYLSYPMNFRPFFKGFG